MRRIAIMILTALTAVCANAEAEITWLGKVHDFGAFDEDTKNKTAYFRFVNTGDEDVMVISASATCGCTKPKYDKNAVHPGDTAVIEVAYDPTGRPGRFEKQIYVRTSASLDRTKLIIRGTVIGNAETVKARYPISTGALSLRNGAAMLGRVYHGHTKMAYIDAYNSSNQTLIPEFTNKPEYIAVYSIPDTIPPGESAILNFYFKGDECDQWGILTDSVGIASNPGETPVMLPIVAIIEEDFTGLTPEQLRDAPQAVVRADRIVLPSIPENSTKEVSGKTKLTNNGKTPLIIHRAYTQDPGLSVSLNKTTLKSGASTDIQVKYNPSVQPTGIINGKITLVTNDPNNPTLTLRVVGERK